METVSREVQQTIDSLQENWVWVPDWTDSSHHNTAGRIVKFSRTLDITTPVSRSIVHISADTRYKFSINGNHVSVGPSRGSTRLWYYDTLDISPYLQEGHNELQILVLRYFSAVRAAMPFGRTAFPGLTVSGIIRTPENDIDISSRDGWVAEILDNVQFPMGLHHDVFLHINERVQPRQSSQIVKPRPYGFGMLNGDILPWRLRPRIIPMQKYTRSVCQPLVIHKSARSLMDWASFFLHNSPLELPANTKHTLDLQAEFHSTAFLRWRFKSEMATTLTLRATYSEGYETEPRSYPFARTKHDRLDWHNGHLIGPCDELYLDLAPDEEVTYEPFWFRTFRMIRLEFTVGPEPLRLRSFDATQANYPLAVKGSWHDISDADSEQFWAVSIRTLRNCMFDGYSDCPFYEQLQYSGDSRSVGLFHYLCSGDNRLMRQAISSFAASTTAEGLTQSRYPSHVPQIIAGFPLYWILQLSDHFLYFGDLKYTKSFLPRIDGVLDFFDSHIDELGLVAGLPADVWQYVDWVTSWAATDEHPDKGVPTSGRKTNRHTFFSLFYAWVLQQAAQLVRAVGRPGHADEYETRARAVVKAVRKHCFDGNFVTDSTADIADNLAYSQHCQVFGVLAGVLEPSEQAPVLRKAFAKDSGLSKCSYVMQFYAFRAFAQAGDGLYEEMWPSVWDPWRKMLRNNLTTWEEDDVRQRSDCHAWGSVPVYEFCTEVAGVQPIAPGCSKILFAPRVTLSKGIDAKVALGNNNLASVSWSTRSNGVIDAHLRLEIAVEVQSQVGSSARKEHGVTDYIVLNIYPSKM